MSGVISLLLVGFFTSSLILSILALASVQKLRRELESGRLGPQRAEPSSPPTPRPAAVPPSPPPVQGTATGRVPPPLPPRATSDERLELTLGSRIASFVGISALVMGVVFFVGYAIREGWIGPLFRVALGLAAGCGLVLGGGRFHTRGAQYATLARALTGGGLALLFMTVFAAHATYALIGRPLAGLGLVACSLAAVVLALRYDSQAVAILGLLGACAMPVLLETDFGRSIVPLVYIAAVNVPVLLLGRRKDWNWLVNLAFAASWSLALAGAGANALNDWMSYVAVMIVLHLQFAALNLVRAGEGPTRGGSVGDVLRLQVSTLLLAFSWAGMRAASGGADEVDRVLFVLAVAHGLGAWVFHRRLGSFRGEAVSLVASSIGLLAASIAVETRGPWLPFSWAALGVGTAYLATRVSSSLLALGGAGLGLAAVALAMPRLGDGVPLVNEPFTTAVAVSALLGAQALAHRRAGTGWPVPLGVAFVGSVVAVVTIDVARIDTWGFMLISSWWTLAALILTVAGLVWRRGYMRVLGLILFLLAILKVFFIDLAALGGMPRVVAFIGLGALLLFLSYAYQRVAPRFLGEEPKDA